MPRRQGWCDTIADWIFNPFSAVITFQKNFVDDITDSVKRQKESFGRHNRELQERAVQLHLDKLEAQYLCAVCGKPGDSREEASSSGSPLSMVSMPARTKLERGLLQNRRLHRLSNTELQDCVHLTSSAHFPSREGAVPCEASIHDGEDTAELSAIVRQEQSVDFYNEVEQRQRVREEQILQEERQVIEDSVLDPTLVPPVAVSDMMNKIRSIVLHKEAKSNHRRWNARRDKGLTMIEEADIELFSRFFQRPLHGYLCNECHACARKRLDELTQQIQTLLFKASHPLLRKVSEKQLHLFTSAGQLSSTVVAKTLDIERRWQAARMLDRNGASHKYGNGGYASGVEKRDTTSSSNTSTLTDATIFSLREIVKCGVCQQRSCCFFVRVNVLFICQFCCARDHFYRDNAVCINDELMPLATVHLLTDLCEFHEQLHQQQRLRQIPETELQNARTDLFGLQESLFVRQGSTFLHRAQLRVPTTRALSPCSPLLPLYEVEPQPMWDLSTEEANQADPCHVAAHTALSLFEGTHLKPVHEDLFVTGTATPPKTSLALVEITRDNGPAAAPTVALDSY